MALDVTHEMVCEVRKLDHEATERPWSEDDGNVFSKPLSDRRHGLVMRRVAGEDVPHPDEGRKNPLGFVCTTEQSTDRSDADARCIAHFRSSAPALAEEVARLRSLVSSFGIEPNDDKILTCVMCGLEDCDGGFMTRAGGRTSWFGIHYVCWKRARALL